MKEKIKQFGSTLKSRVFMIICGLIVLLGVTIFVMTIVALVKYGGKPLSEVPMWAWILLRK